MESVKRQGPLPVIHGDSAIGAIRGLMQQHPHLAHHIQLLGCKFLRHANGLRDGRNGASKTYDLSFVNDSGAFACLTAEPGKWNRATDGQLQVQLRHKRDRDLRPLKLKGRCSEADRGWHAAELAAEDDAAALLGAIVCCLDE